MRSFECALVGLVLGIGVSPAHAEEAAPVHPVLHDRFYLGVGAFVPRMVTSAQVDAANLGVGTNIDFEKALGMPAREVVPDFFARYRFDQRWRIDVEYFAVDRSGSRTLDRDIQWGDHVFPANTQLNSTFDFSDTRVSVGYSFFRTADKEAGAGFGFHVAKYRTSLSAAVVGNESGDTLAPLPVLSAYAQFALTEEWAVGGRVDWFSMSYDHYSGNVSSVAVNLMYQPFRNVGFGLGYRSLFIALTHSTPGATVEFDQSFRGPLLSMNVSF
jgi:hypothetical protein